MRIILALFGLLGLFVVTGCEEEHEHHHGGPYGGAYDGYYQGYGHDYYRGYPNYGHDRDDWRYR